MLKELEQQDDSIRKSKTEIDENMSSMDILRSDRKKLQSE